MMPGDLDKVDRRRKNVGKWWKIQMSVYASGEPKPEPDWKSLAKALFPESTEYTFAVDNCNVYEEEELMMEESTDTFTLNNETITKSPDITTTPIDKLLPLDPDIMKKWEGFRKFADKKGCHYPDYFVILLWEEYKNVRSSL